MVRIATIAESMPGSLKLCYGESDLPTPPFICDALDRAARTGHTYYTHTAGSPDLRQAIADKVFELHQVRCDAAGIMATVGGSMAIYAAIRAFIGPGTNAVIVSPAYAIYANGVALCGGAPRPVPLTLTGDRFCLDIDRVERAIDPATRLLVVNSPSNPTGWVATEDEQRQLAELADRHGLALLADEVYERLIYDGRTIAPSFARLPHDPDRLIVVNSFSKTYNMTGWRLGWAQSSAANITTLYKAVEFMTSNPTAMVQQAGLAALKDGEPFIRELREHYQRRRDEVVAALRRMHGVTLPDPAGAFYAFPKFSDMVDSTSFTEELVRASGLAVAPGVGFGETGEGFIRLCFASSEATVNDALARLQNFFSRHRS